MAQGLSVWVLDAPDGLGDMHHHAHHAVQLTFSLAGNLEMQGAGQTLVSPAIAVDADAPHRLAGRGLVAIVFVEPESPAGRALRAQLFGHGPLAVLETERLVVPLAALGNSIAAALPRQEMLAHGIAIQQALATIPEAGNVDPRIRRIIDYAATHIDQPLALSNLPAGVYLSPSRLRHLFVEQTGLAFKTYLLWLRMIRALQVYSEGTSLTEAAHAAGFSDSAHFSRVFRRMFGLPATTLTRV